jgi:hypothetical protein
MTRKDYLLIAEAIQRTRYTNTDTEARCRYVIDMVAENLANMLATDNKNFDRERFLAACSGESVQS